MIMINMTAMMNNKDTMENPILKDDSRGMQNPIFRIAKRNENK